MIYTTPTNRARAPFASLKYHPRERGRLARNLIPRWRRWSLAEAEPNGEG